MRTLLRGAAVGAGYGLAVTCAETWLMTLRLAEMNLPPMTPPAAGIAAQVALGAASGALLAPLLRVRPVGWLWHLLAVAGLWLGLGLAASVEGDFFFVLTVGPPALGLLLSLVGHGLGRWRRWLPAAAGAAVLLAAFGFAQVRGMRGAAPRPDVAARAPAPPGAPDVVIVVLDTVRAASVSAYGYPRPTTPNLDALALDGALFLDATAPANWSLPSHASLFTGLFPSAHGAHDEHHHLREDVPTLGEVLARAGWETACFTANPWISETLGTARGFDRCDEGWRTGGAGANMGWLPRLLDLAGLGARDKGGAAVAATFEDWVARRPRDARPFFAFLNFIEAHFPYHQLPDDHLARWSTLGRTERRALSMQLFADQFGTSGLDRAAAVLPARDLYDAGIAYADHLLGRVAGALRERGTLDSTIFVVLSDHGELVGEHDAFGHGRSLFEPDTRVPLVVRHPPAIPAARVPTPVSTVGVMATVLDLAGLDAPPGLHVGSLRAAIAGGPPAGPVLAERFADPEGNGRHASPLLSRDVRLRAYRAGTLKLIEASTGERFLFDLAADPGETADAARARPQDLARLAGELATWSAAVGLPALDAPLAAAGPAPELDPAARERLRALGYVE